MDSSKGPRLTEGRTAEIFAWAEGYILKLYREEYPAGEAEGEAKLARIAHAAGLRTPAVIDLVTVEGRQGIIYEKVSGPTMFEEIMREPAQFMSMAALLAELQAAMHTQHVPALPRQRQRLQRHIGRTSLAPETKTAVLAFLERLPDDDVLCHGDFHPNNILITARGPVIIDWVDATQGHPLADVARTALLLRLGGFPPEMNEPDRRQLTQIRQLFCDAYLERYLQLRPGSLDAIDQWQVPVAAARLMEGFDQDEHLLAIVRRAVVS